MSGSNVLVGAHGVNHETGAAYLFNTSGQLLQTFLDPNGSEYDLFGGSVALSDSNVLVGADGVNDEAGAAYLYNTTGQLLQTFQPLRGAEFGFSVALSSKYVLVGPDIGTPGLDYTNAADLYSTSGQLLQTIRNPISSQDDGFGYSLAVSDSDVLMGAPDYGVFAPGYSPDEGAAYLFNTSGVLVQTFQDPNSSGFDGFGFSVALSGSNALVGASGVVYLYTNSDTLTFTQQPNNALANQFIGPAVTVDVDNAIGQLDTSFNGLVTIALGNDPVHGTLSGTLQVNAVNGVATFDDLTINEPGTGYTLLATSDGLVPVPSPSFDVTTISATSLSLDSSNEGVDYSYTVTGGNVPDGVPVSLYWSSNSSFDGQLGLIDGTEYTIPADTAASATPYTRNVAASVIQAVDPPSSTHDLLEVVGDPNSGYFDPKMDVTALALPILDASLSWNVNPGPTGVGNGGGVTASLEIDNANLPAATNVELYWIHGIQFDPSQIANYTLAYQFAAGTFPPLAGGPYRATVCAKNLQPPPSGMPGANDDLHLAFVVNAPLSSGVPYGAIIEGDRGHDVGFLDASPAAILAPVEDETTQASVPTISVSTSETGWIDAYFRPAGGALTITDAQAICGVDHFNWVQQRTAPSDWKVYKFLGFQGHDPILGDTLPLTGPDPETFLIAYSSPFLTSKSYLNGIPFATGNAGDGSGYYFDENPQSQFWYGRGYIDAFTFNFFDRPEAPSGMYGPTEYKLFTTRLVGVSSDSQQIDLPQVSGITFHWKDNATYTADPAVITGGGVYLTDRSIQAGFFPPIDSGGVTDVHVDQVTMAGPSGYGPQNFIPPGRRLSYQLDFENSVTATAPVQKVVITDQLDANLDWSTFQLTGLDFGSNVITVPAGLRDYQTSVPMTYDDTTFDVQIAAELDTSTGLLSVTFQAIDPTTGLPPDVLTGFLLPEDGTGRGLASVHYTIQARTGLPTGTQIRNIASVAFDANPALEADLLDDESPGLGIDPDKQALVTIDAGPPSSSVLPLASSSAANFTVSWAGQDDAGGSGIGGYDVYVSDNGGPFTPFQTNTSATSAVFTGWQNGHTYAFYSVAIDNVGNVQPTPDTAQATTQVDLFLPSSNILTLSSDSPGSFTVSWSGSAGSSGSPIASYDIYYSDNGGPFTSLITDTTSTSMIFTGQNGHTYGFYSVATDSAGNTQSIPAIAQTSTQVDSVAPTSQVFVLPSYSSSTFTIFWFGSDDPGGLGLAFYDIFVSDNGSAFMPLLSQTTDTSTSFTGVDGHTYGFYSIATDQVGNIQKTPTAAQASTLIRTATQLVVTAQPPGSVTAGRGFTVTIQAEDANGNVDSGFTSNVTLARNGISGGSPLSVKAAGGVATFTNVTLDQAGPGYTLQATTDGLPSVVTNAIAITPAAASQLVVIGQPPAVSR